MGREKEAMQIGRGRVCVCMCLCWGVGVKEREKRGKGCQKEEERNHVKQGNTDLIAKISPPFLFLPLD
jgi:hypothetical protein